MSGELNPAGPLSRAIEQRPAPATCEGQVPMGVYRAGPIVLAPGDAAPLPLDASGALVVSSSGGGTTVVTQAPLSAGPVSSATGAIFPPTAGLAIGAFTARETGAPPAPARFTLHNGTGPADPVVGFVNLVAGQEMGGDWGGSLIDISAGLWLEVVSGDVEIAPMTRVV